MMLILPQNIRSIISILNRGGFSAHIVGGCVRDLLLGRIPKDWDITTDATPLAVSSLFEKTYNTGIKHGTITVAYNGQPVEITTWRSESDYSDHRHPDSIRYAPSLTEDLSRRDFTMNAIAYHPDEGLTDPFNGSADIGNKLIRCVGDAVKRFSEDALRMMRAIRFSAVLGFDIEDKTFSAIEKCSEDLKYISMERIQAEINKLLTSEYPQKIELLWQTHLNKTIFPGIDILPSPWTSLTGEISRIYKEPSLFHAASVFDKKTVLLSLLFYFSQEKEGLKTGQDLLKRLKYDGTTLRRVHCLMECMNSYGTFSPRNQRRMAVEFGMEAAIIVPAIFGLIDKGRNNPSRPRPVHGPLAPGELPTSLSITGADLNRKGHEGKDIGQMLYLLHLCVCEKPMLNEPAALMAIAGEIQKTIVWRNRD